MVRMRFRLKTILIVVAAIALLLAQYPYTEFYPVAVAVGRVPNPKTGIEELRQTGVVGYRGPSMRFAGVLLAEVMTAIAYSFYASRTRREKPISD